MTTIDSPTLAVRMAANYAAGALSGSANHRLDATPTVGAAAGNVNRIAVVELAVVNNATPTVVDLTSVRDVGGALVSFSFLTHWLLTNASVIAGQDFTAGGGSNPVIPADPEVCQANGGYIAKGHPDPGLTVDGTHKNFQVSVATGTNVAGRLTLWGRT